MVEGRNALAKPVRDSVVEVMFMSQQADLGLPPFGDGCASAAIVRKVLELLWL